MKLATKMLLAPMAALAAVLAIGLGNNVYSLREVVAANEAGQQRNDVFMTMVSVQTQVGEMHGSVFRTIALMASLDDAKVKALRAQLKAQVDGLTRTLAALETQDITPPETDAHIQTALPLLQAYLGKADAAIDLASVDPNTGVAAMQEAEARYKELAALMGKIVQSMGAEEQRAAYAGRKHGNAQPAHGAMPGSKTPRLGRVGGKVIGEDVVGWDVESAERSSRRRYRHAAKVLPAGRGQG